MKHRICQLTETIKTWTTKKKTMRWSSHTSTIIKNRQIRRFKTKLLAMMAKSSELTWMEKKKSFLAMAFVERPSLMATQLFTSITAISSKHTQTKRLYTTLLRPRQLRQLIQMVCKCLSFQTLKLKSTTQTAPKR